MSIAESGKKPTIISREQTAWAVLLISFACFVVLALSIPLTVNWYLETASVPKLASAQGTSGTTLIANPTLPADAVLRVNGGERRTDISERSELRTDANSQILVEFFDNSTLTIFPNSTVTLREMRRARFGRSSRPDRIIVVVSNGRVRAQVAANSEPIHLVLQTPQAPAPHGGISLAPGSYAIESSNEETHVSVRSGVAFVSGQTGHTITLKANERAEIALGAAATGPLPARRNLLVNSDFQQLEVAVPISRGPLAGSWTVTSDQGGDGGTVDGTVDVVTTGATRALHFVRESSNNNHGETSVTQPIRKLVGDYLALTLRLDVRIVNQSLSGGGEQSSEFPLIVRIDYRDRYGEPQHWTHGFYCRNPARYNIQRGTEIACDTRRPVEFDLKKQLNNPTTIESIQLYASGWDWDVYVSDLELSAE